MENVYIVTLGDEYDDDMGVYGVFNKQEDAIAHMELLEKTTSYRGNIYSMPMNVGKVI